MVKAAQLTFEVSEPNSALTDTVKALPRANGDIISIDLYQSTSVLTCIIMVPQRTQQIYTVKKNAKN